MAAILGETNYFLKLGKVLRRDILRVKNFVEIALSSTVLDTLRVKNFVEIALSSTVFEI